MAFSQDTGGRPDGSIGRFWSVDCLQDSHSDAATLAYFHWDADTGDLVTASFSAPFEVPKGKHSSFTARQAIEKSWYWLRALGFAREGTRWQCDREPYWKYSNWTLHWQGRERSVTMHIDAISGDFLNASTVPDTTAGR